MANEISVTTTVTLANGTLVASFAPAAFTIDQTDAKVSNQVLDIGTTEENVSFGDITTGGQLCIQNHDATNFVEVYPSDSTGDAFAKLLAGEVAIIPLQSGVTVTAKADTATCEVQFCLFSR